MTIFIVRTTTGRERQVIDRLFSRVKNFEAGEIKAIFNPQEVRGYIFIEAVSRDDVLHLISHMSNVKGLVRGEIAMNEVEHFFAPKMTTINIIEKDIVEIISGPFKGEKAKVNRVNMLKEDVVVELLEAAVPIPITLKIDAVRVIRREEQESEEGAPSA